MECVWIIQASPGNRIGISIHTVDIKVSDNCHDSYLEIRETDESGKLLALLCGQSLMSNLTSANSYWVKFRSGIDGTGNGFLAEYYHGKTFFKNIL